MVLRKGPEGQTPGRREGGDHTAAPGTNGSQRSQRSLRLPTPAPKCQVERTQNSFTDLVKIMSQI